MNLKYISTIELLLVSIMGFSQKISGRTTDGANGLPFVSIVLLNADSTIVSVRVTENIGTFEFLDIPKGKYSIATSMVGYRQIEQVLFEVAGDIVLPDIILKESSTELGEVVVEAQKDVVKLNDGNLVINVAQSITNTGNSLMDVIQKLPGVVVDRQSGDISMNGRSSARLMINGKLIQVPPDVAAQMLEGVNASNIDKIELLASPPAGIDADGSAGIIHKTKVKARIFPIA